MAGALCPCVTFGAALDFPLQTNASSVQQAALFSSKACGGFLSLAVRLCKYSSRVRGREFPCVVPEQRVIHVDFLWVGSMCNRAGALLAAALVTHGAAVLP